TPHVSPSYPPLECFLLTHAPPAGDLVLPVQKRCQKYPPTLKSVQSSHIIADVLRTEKTLLKPSNRAVRRKSGVSCGSAEIRPAVAPVTTRVGSQCRPCATRTGNSQTSF